MDTADNANMDLRRANVDVQTYTTYDGKMNYLLKIKEVACLRIKWRKSSTLTWYINIGNNKMNQMAQNFYAKLVDWR